MVIAVVIEVRIHIVAARLVGAVVDPSERGGVGAEGRQRHQRARHQRHRAPEREVIGLGTILAADLVHVARTARDDERRLRTLLLDGDVDGDEEFDDTAAEEEEDLEVEGTTSSSTSTTATAAPALTLTQPYHGATNNVPVVDAVTVTEPPRETELPLIVIELLVK